MLMQSLQTGWNQASRQVTRRLVWDPTCLLLRKLFLIKIKSKYFKRRQHMYLYFENYPAFKGL